MGRRRRTRLLACAVIVAASLAPAAASPSAASTALARESAAGTRATTAVTTTTVTTATTAVTATTATFTATADTFVDASAPGTAFGSATLVRVDGSPARTTLLAFAVAGLAGPVQTAKLRLYCSGDPSAAGGTIRSVAPTWSESAVTWATAPTPDPAVLGALGSVAVGRWYEVDVTAQVRAEGSYGFALSSTNADGAAFATKEAAASKAPQLVVTSAPSGTGPQPVTFPVSQDTFVAKDTPTTVYGSATSVRVDASPVKESLLAFTVTGLTGPVTSARLRLYCANDPSVVGGRVHRVGSGWAEATTTWATAPPLDPGVLGALGAVATGHWYEVDVTAAVTGNGPVGLGIESPNADGANYASREAGAATAPRLVVAAAPGPGPDVTPPTVALTAPLPGASLTGGAVTLGATAADDVGVAGVRFALDGAPLGPASTATPYTLTWDSRTTTDGPHALTAVATDSAGNATTSAPVAVVVANRPAGPCAPAASTTGPPPATPPATYAHVVWIWMENHDAADVLGPTAAGTGYEQGLRDACGSSTDYRDDVAPTLESLPNYLVAVAGSNCVTGLATAGTGCIVDDGPPAQHTLPTTSLFEQVAAAGLTWRAYQEGMPSACATTNAGRYAVKHNPPAYFDDLAASCAGSDVAFPGTACTATGCTAAVAGPLLDDITNGTLPAFSFVTPDLCNDTHDCAPAVGDRWLETWLGRLTAGPNYLAGDTAVFVMWDEGATAGGTIPNLVLTPYTPPTTPALTMNHAAVLRTTEDLLGLPDHLGCAGGLQPGTSVLCPAGWDADLRAAFHL